MSQYEKRLAEISYPKWKISWDYGYYTAIHDNYDAEWAGEEDGWVDNGLIVSARTIPDLVQEIEAKEKEFADAN